MSPKRCIIEGGLGEADRILILHDMLHDKALI